jgi:methyltransferase
MLPAGPVAVLVLLAVFLLMLVEAQLAWHNERKLRAGGALEPAGDVYGLLRVVYPASFVLIAVAAAFGGAVSRRQVLAGLALFGASKLLKWWAILTLRWRWSFRVLIPPGAALVTTGPYRFLRHPNYVALVGEFVSVAVALGTWIGGAAALAIMLPVLWQRIQVEERAHLEHHRGGTQA